MTSDLSRRRFLKEGAALAAAVAAMQSSAATAAEPSVLPKIKLGTLEVSRLILGSNPFWGYAHQPGDVGRQMTEFYTDQRIGEVLDQAAELGVTTVACPPDRRWIDLYKRYLDRGGKMRIWIAQAHGSPEKIPEEITRAVKAGAQAVFIQGHRAEDAFAQGKADVVRGWIEHIKSHNVPAGMAAHRPDVHLAAEKAGFPTDFYYQSFFIPDTYRPEDRQKAVETIGQLAKPVIGYKILAAGRLKPEEAFRFAFEHLKPKDGVCVGIFPKNKPDMLAEDTRLARSLSAG